MSDDSSPTTPLARRSLLALAAVAVADLLRPHRATAQTEGGGGGSCYSCTFRNRICLYRIGGRCWYCDQRTCTHTGHVCFTNCAWGPG